MQSRQAEPSMLLQPWATSANPDTLLQRVMTKRWGVSWHGCGVCNPANVLSCWVQRAVVVAEDQLVINAQAGAGHDDADQTLVGRAIESAALEVQARVSGVGVK